MNLFSPKFINFSIDRMRTQGDEIRKWSTSDNPLLSQTCREIIEAAQGGQKWK